MANIESELLTFRNISGGRHVLSWKQRFRIPRDFSAGFCHYMMKGRRGVRTKSKVENTL